MKVVFPGSFDPMTLGHYDVVSRASKLFDQVIVTVAQNSSKNTLLTMDERVELATEICADLSNVTVTTFTGLLVDYAKSNNINFILRSLRGAQDVTWELQLAMMNRKMVPDVETIFMPPSDEYQSISATLVREIAINKGDLSPFVDERVAVKLQEVVSRGN